MQRQITRASVFTKTNKRARSLARALELTLPECWEKLMDFGADALKRQQVLLTGTEQEATGMDESEGTDSMPSSTTTK